jgi:ATP-binding cassette subfamily C (CFTR/MRP) protein 2
MSIDADRIRDFSWYLQEFWSVPLQILVALFVLYKSLGLASLVGLSAIVVIMIGNAPLKNLQEKFQDKIMEAKDKRMKATSETLRNMKILKLQAMRPLAC